MIGSRPETFDLNSEISQSALRRLMLETDPSVGGGICVSTGGINKSLPDWISCTSEDLSDWLVGTMSQMHLQWKSENSWPCISVSQVFSVSRVKMTKMGFLRLSYEKQDTLLKLLILSMAAVLCECLLFCLAMYYSQAMSKYLTLSLCVSPQRFPLAFSLCWGSRASSMSSIRKYPRPKMELVRYDGDVYHAWLLVSLVAPGLRYFNYRTTRFLAEEGFYKFHNWFDDRAWYPLGRIIGGTIYPGTLSENERNTHMLW